jgi:hypothetical protein
MDKPRYIIVTRTFFPAADDAEARQFARVIEKAMRAAHHNNICMNTQLDVKLQRQVQGKAPEGIQL